MSNPSAPSRLTLAHASIMDVGRKFESLLVFELLRADSFPEDRIPARPLSDPA